MHLMDGLSTVRALRRLEPSLKIIVSIGLLMDVNSIGVTGFDIQRYRAKPYTADQLASMVS